MLTQYTKLRPLSIENHTPKGNHISASIAINALRTHTKEKPLQCGFCKKGFTKKSRKNSYQRETISV